MKPSLLRGLITGALVTLATFAPVGASAAANYALEAGGIAGTFHVATLNRGDNAAWVAVRFGVNPVRVRPTVEGGASAMRVDTRRVVPTFASDLSGLVLNVPEAQVYLVNDGVIVKDYPVAVSVPDKPVPIGTTRVVSKQKNPTWFIPESIQKEMAGRGRIVRKSVAPGPRNPLGPRWIGIWDGSFGMHGTNVPTSIKKYASHGCVRFRAGDIKDLYERVAVGTPVHVVYQPLLLGVTSESVHLQAYPDFYKRKFDYRAAVKALATQANALEVIDWQAVENCLRYKSGILVNVTRGAPNEPEPVARPTRPHMRPVRPHAEPATPAPYVPDESDELEGIPPELLQEKPVDPWFTQ